MLFIQSAALVIAAVGLAIVGYRLLRFPAIGLNRLSDHDLGRLEGSLTDLRRVIVIAHEIEDPEHELRAAVQENFRRGVKYLFLISKSTARNELKGYYRIFKTLAEIVIEKHDLQHDPNVLVEIQGLPYDWPDYPYVFYEAEVNGSGSTFIAFRGSQAKEGIADFYSPVPARYAHTIARAVLSEAPHPIEITADQFTDNSNVVSISSGRSREKA